MSMKKMKTFAINGEQFEIMDEFARNDDNIVSNNLLINSNFANPVNQRGKRSLGTGVNGYWIDRWEKYANISTAIKDGYIEITRGSQTSNISLVQTLEENLLGKTVTFSVKLFEKDNVISVTATIPKIYNTADEIMLGEIDPVDNCRLTIWQRVDGLVRVQIVPQNSSTIKVEWAKLEIGEVATPYVPRLYQEEFNLCERFFQVINLNTAVLIGVYPNYIAFRRDHRTKPRITPTSSFHANSTIRLVVNGNGNKADGFEYSIPSTNRGYTAIYATKDSHGYTQADLLTMDGDIFVDAEL